MRLSAPSGKFDRGASCLLLSIEGIKKLVEVAGSMAEKRRIIEKIGT